MKKKMLFFVNPNAGHAEIRNSLMEVLQIFTVGGYDVTVHPTTGPRDLTRQIAACGQSYDLIVCTGGDGTLNEVVSGLMQLKNRPPLGYIPGGTVNDVAATLGLSHNPIAAAQDIIHGKPFPLDIGSFGPAHWFTYVAGFGAFTDVAYETPQQDKRTLGRLAYLLAGVRALGEIKPIHVRVRSAERFDELDALVGLVCSTTSVGGFKAKPDMGIRLNDGRSEVVLVKDIKNLLDFNTVANSILRLDFQNENFVMYQTDAVQFEFDKPVAWTLDGEYGGDVTQVDIRNNQCAIEIIIPQA